MRYFCLEGRWSIGGQGRQGDEVDRSVLGRRTAVQNPAGARGREDVQVMRD
jgi:hypothetical protein